MPPDHGPTDLGHTVRLVSSRFDHTSDPAGDSQGDPGRDLAEFLRDGLHGHGVQAETIHRSWGWQAEAPLEGGVLLEIAVFHMGDDEEGNDPDLWELAIHASRPKRRLLFFSRRVDVPVPPELLSAVRKILTDGGARIERFEAGHA